MNEGKYVFTQVLSFLARFDSEDGIFITRAKDNMKFEIMSSNFNIDESSGVVGYHLIRLTGLKTHLWVAISAYLLLVKIKAVYNSPFFYYRDSYTGKCVSSDEERFTVFGNRL